MLIQLLLNGIIAGSIYSVITQIAQMFTQMEESVIARNESDGVGGMTWQSDILGISRLLHYVRNDLYSYVLLERIHN